MCGLFVMPERFSVRRMCRSEFYSYFYPLVVRGGQLRCWYTAFGYSYNWKYMYYFMMFDLISILFVIICFRHNAQLKVPCPILHIVNFVHFDGLLMLMLRYQYMESARLDGFGKYVIYHIAPMLMPFYLVSEPFGESLCKSCPFVSAPSNCRHFYMMLVCFSVINTLLTNYLTIILKVTITHYLLSLYLFASGICSRALFCFWWFRWQRWRFRFL